MPESPTDPTRKIIDHWERHHSLPSSVDPEHYGEIRDGLLAAKARGVPVPDDLIGFL